MLLGLLVAAAYGAGDFFGGLSSKRASVAAVVVLSQLSGLPLLAVLVLLTGGDPTTTTFVLGALAGAVGGVGLTTLYRGLASGRMSVVAPITAVGAAIVPVLWGLVTGERPSLPAVAGIVLAVVAVGLISRTPDDAPLADHVADDGTVTTPETVAPVAPYLALAVLAGLAFGTVFVLLAATGEGVGFWPLVAGRTTSITLLALGARATGRRLLPPDRRALPLIAAAGVLDVTANALYLLAARQGLLALVAVLSSLYPASTVLLARIVLRERLTPVQVGGLGLAGFGVVLIAAG